jgi:hypothetical protein
VKNFVLTAQILNVLRIMLDVLGYWVRVFPPIYIQIVDHRRRCLTLNFRRSNITQVGL